MVKGERNPIGPNIHAAACNTPLFVFFFILQKIHQIPQIKDEVTLLHSPCQSKNF